MSSLKIAAIAGSMIIAAGGSAAVATRSKWLPKSEISTNQDPEDASKVPPAQSSKAVAAPEKQCNPDEQETAKCTSP